MTEASINNNPSSPGIWVEECLTYLQTENKTLATENPYLADYRFKLNELPIFIVYLKQHISLNDT